MPNRPTIFSLLLFFCCNCVRSGFGPRVAINDSQTADTSSNPSNDAGRGASWPLGPQWTKKREIIVGGSTSDLISFPIQAVVEWARDMRTDYSDLRFVDKDGKLLDYWIESSSSQNAKIWIKIPQIPKSGAVISFFYGNPNALSQSSLSRTFPWVIESVDTGDIQHVSLALDRQNQPHISYREQITKKLKYAKWNGGKWENYIVDTAPDTGSHSSLALDASGAPHIAYFDLGNQVVKYAVQNGNSWQIRPVENGGSDYGSYTSLALDANSIPHLSYRRGGTRELKYAKWDNGTWKIEPVDMNCTADTALKIVDGHPHIAYHLCDGSLFFAEPQGASWNSQPVDTQADYVTLAFDSLGRPHILYYTFDYILKYAPYNNGQWKPQVIKPIGYPSTFLEAYFDSYDRMHVGYQDYAQNHVLGYARWNGTSWETEIVDANGDTGHDPSIAADSYGFPSISYVQNTLALKYAYRRKPASPEPTITFGEETTLPSP